MQQPASLIQFFNDKVQQYNQPAFIAADPVCIPHAFTQQQDIEIAGFFAAIFAWGNRTTIIAKSKELLKIAFDNAQSAYQTAQEQLIVLKDNRELAQMVYQQTLLQYQEGMASMADLLNVNSDFLQADNSYNQQVLKCKTSEIQMLKASGNLKSLVSQKQ